MILDIAFKGIYLTLLISGLPLLVAVVSGLIVAILQAATSVQEQTTIYLTKLISLIFSLALFGSWFTSEILEYFKQCLKYLALNIN